MHCRALGIGESGIIVGRMGWRAHSLGLSSCIFQVSVLNLQARAEGEDPGPHSLFWGQG